MKVRTVLTAALVAAASLVAASGAGARSVKPDRQVVPIEPHYYLALGDSLSTGFQPTATGGAANTTQGYVNDLFAYEQRYVTGLTLVQMGCPGDTTASLLTGHGNAAAARAFTCNRAGGSQLAAAVAFLKAHHTTGEVPLVTIDIGANDVDGCTGASDVDSCVAAGLGTIDTNLPKIFSALRRAAPAGTRFVTMNLYNPVESLYLQPTTSSLQPLGLASVALLRQVNGAIQTNAASAGFRVADVASAFDSYDTTTMVTWNGVSVPKSLALLCAWTWACTPPPVGPNIHANQLGYGVIAQAFEKVVGKL